MIKIVLTALLFPMFSFAAPTGQAVCKDQTGKYTFTVGTYALSGDPGTLTVENDASYGVDAEAGVEGDLNSLITAFCVGCAPKQGFKVASVKWDITSGTANQPNTIQMIITGQKVTELNLTCENHLTPGTEQDLNQ
ncbi:hypothetical protein ACLSU7_08390 [Bdellovibrio sp. HCB185ZH]|uniref:hypothetical protein n=1 Tax=Bdellovibrio sp. HCB185ZH TaxID=3394235 RepID=UPI0039A5AACB